MDAKRQALSLVAKGAMASVRLGLCRHPAALAAFALAAGLSAAQNSAFAGQYEAVGRSIGYELGRAAGSGPQGRIASIVLQAAGGAAAGTLDAPPLSADQRRIQDLQRQAREQAARDAAYANERRRIDPGYVEPPAGARAPGMGAQVSLSADQRRAQQLEKEAREQAIRDHAYAAERQRLDPTYGTMAQRSDRANAQAAEAQDINRAYRDRTAGAAAQRRQDVEAP